MSEYYKISGERLTGIAEQARRLGKISGSLTPGQIVETLATVTTELPVYYPFMVTAEVKPNVLTNFAENDTQIIAVAALNIGVTLEDVTPPPTPKHYFNGVLLPGILAALLAEYPYAWIRTNTRTGYYDLLLSQSKWYAKDEDTLAHSDSNTIKWLRIEIATADTAEAWTFNSDYSSETWGAESDRQILWSNTDIPNGSADATEIYFEGSEPVPAE